jgi:hypothetical protein
VLNVVDGCIPSDLAAGTAVEIEEEWRLLYVAMTRVKNHLDLLVPQRFYVSSQRSHGDQHMQPRGRAFCRMASSNVGHGPPAEAPDPGKFFSDHGRSQTNQHCGAVCRDPFYFDAGKSWRGAERGHEQNRIQKCA